MVSGSLVSAGDQQGQTPTASPVVAPLDLTGTLEAKAADEQDLTSILAVGDQWFIADTFAEEEGQYRLVSIKKVNEDDNTYLVGVDGTDDHDEDGVARHKFWSKLVK